MRTLSLFIVLAVLPVYGGGTGDELAAARRARAQLQSKIDAVEANLGARVRALYKLSAFGDLPLWVDEGARGAAVVRRGAARRFILRDLNERKLLRAELAAADADLARLERTALRARALAAFPIRDGSLVRPVSGDVVASFGTYTDEASHVRLFRRGIELGVRAPEVFAAAAGQVTYAGPLGRLGTVIVVDHGQGIVTITQSLARALVARGDLVAAGQSIGRAAGNRLRFEVRKGGRPIDPFPLLSPH